MTHHWWPPCLGLLNPTPGTLQEAGSPAQFFRQHIPVPQYRGHGPPFPQEGQHALPLFFPPPAAEEELE